MSLYSFSVRQKSKSIYMTYKHLSLVTNQTSQSIPH